MCYLFFIFFCFPFIFSYLTSFSVAFPPTCLFKCHIFLIFSFPLPPFHPNLPQSAIQHFPKSRKFRKQFSTQRSISLLLCLQSGKLICTGASISICPTFAGYGLHPGPPPTHLALGDTKPPPRLDVCVSQTPPKALSVLSFLSLVPRTAPVPPAQMASLRVPNFHGGEGFPRQEPFIQRLLQEQG